MCKMSQLKKVEVEANYVSICKYKVVSLFACCPIITHEPLDRFPHIFMGINRPQKCL